MGTALANKTIAAACVPIEQQIFAKYAHSLFRLFLSELDGCGDRVPIAPEQSPSRCSRPDPGKKMVLFLSQHGSAPWRIVRRGFASSNKNHINRTAAEVSTKRAPRGSQGRPRRLFGIVEN